MRSHRPVQGERTRHRGAWIWFTCAVLLAGLASGILYQQTRDYAIGQAEDQIRNLMSYHQAVHLYVQRDAHPAFYNAKELGYVDNRFYSPEFLSSSYMVRNMHAYLNEVRKADGWTELYYKMAATNPRNPVNAADSLEVELIELFQSNRDLTEYREIVELDGQKYLYYARPFLETTDACLRCHGDRQDAPPQLQSLYTEMGGFDEGSGNIRAIESIRAPIEGELAAAQAVCLAVLLAGLGISVLCFVNRRLALRVRSRTATLERQMAERERIEKALRESEERLQCILDTIQAGVMVIDGHSRRVIEANPMALRMIGAPREAVVGRRCHEFFCHSDAHRCPITEVGQETDSAERTLRTSQGQTIAVFKTVTPVTLDGEELLLECFVDISDRKEAERRLQENMAELEQFNRLAIGREERMIELKHQVNEMARKAGEPQPFDLAASGLEREPGITERAGRAGAEACTGGPVAPSCMDQTVKSQ